LTRLKYEPLFLRPDELSTYTFLSAGDPYQASISERLRAQWIEEAKLLDGDFVPSGLSHPIATVQKSRLKEIVEELKKLFLSDWNDVNFVIGSKYYLKLIIFTANPLDFIEVKF